MSDLARRLWRDQPGDWTELDELLRRDWAVRVLDAWRQNPPTIIVYGKPFSRDRRAYYGNNVGGRLLLVTIAVMMPGVPGDTSDAEAREQSLRFDGETDAAARLAAARAVYPDLPEAVRQELGECPSSSPLSISSSMAISRP